MHSQRFSRALKHLALATVTFASSAALAGGPFRPESGRYNIDSIDSFPEFVRGSASLHLTRAEGKAEYVGVVFGMKTFGFDFPEIPAAISLSGKVFEEKWLGRTRERLGLVGLFISEGQSCFLRLSALASDGYAASTSKDILFVGWLDCGKKKRVQLGFSAQREVIFASYASMGR